MSKTWRIKKCFFFFLQDSKEIVINQTCRGALYDKLHCIKQLCALVDLYVYMYALLSKHQGIKKGQIFYTVTM